MKFIILLLTTSLFFPVASIAARYIEGVQEVIWGTYCGECAEHCATVFKITPGEMFIDSSDSIFKFLGNGVKNYEFVGTKAHESDYKSKQWLLKHIPSALFSHEAIIGNPDGHDQCGIIVRVKAKNGEVNILIDPEQIPEDLKPFIERLFILDNKRH